MGQLVIDFSQFDASKRPTLILRNLDGTPISALGYAYDLSGRFLCSEVSELTFSYPGVVDGKAIEAYDLLTGMSIVDAVGIGQFLLVNPAITESKTKRIKTVTAYSLEYEFTSKKLSLENSTYNFWNPVDPTDTILGIILERMPSWSVGEVDRELIGKYRTFDVSNENLYNFMMGTLQDVYKCLFDFDTYNRKINVRSTTSYVITRPVYISLDNLAKEIEVTENTENLFTCLDVNGAEGVTIRDVNPTGTNKIYNLDYFMQTGHFSDEIKAKWESWKSAYEGWRQPYFNLTVESALLTAQHEAAKAQLVTLNGELDELEALQSVDVEAAGKKLSPAVPLATHVENINKKKTEITTQETSIATIKTRIDEITKELQAANAECTWEAHGFTDDELVIIDRYIKEDAISESSFVVSEVDSYGKAGKSKILPSVNIKVNASIYGAILTSGKAVYGTTGGTVEVTSGGEQLMSGNVVRAAVDYKDGEFIFTAYTENGCVTCYGSGTLTTDCSIGDTGDDGDYREGTYVAIAGTNVTYYQTTNLTEYSQRSVAWDLLEYGEEELKKVAFPTYTFSVSAANFLSLDSFASFRRQLTLGERIYLNLGDSFGVLEPILVGVEVEFENDRGLTLNFSDTFSVGDTVGKLADLLDKSVSMGKSVDFSKYNYGSFVDSGASSSVEEFITSALDVSNNKLMSSTGQAITWDGSGLRLRKYLSRSVNEFEDEQIWMINNSIVFTSDNWASAEMAIGKFEDSNLGTCWGTVAPNIVGTLLAGQNLVIESEKQDGGVSVFKVDADGAKLYNSSFDLVNEFVVDQVAKMGQIGLHPSVGLTVGVTKSENDFYSYDQNGNINGIKTEDGNVVTKIADLKSDDAPVAKLWADMYGDVYLRGTVYATDGEFSGTVYAKDGEFTGTVHATDGEFTGTVNAKDLQLNGVSINDVFQAVGDDQDLDYLKVGQIIIDGKTGSIKWETTGTSSPVKYQYSANGTSWHDTLLTTDYWRRESWDGGTTWGAGYQFRGKDGEDADNLEVDFDTINDMLGNMFEEGTTNISGSHLYSPEIYAGKIYAGEGASTFAQISDNGFAVYHENNSQPKVYMGCNSGGTVPEIRIGAGATAYMTDIMHITKPAGRGGLYYYTESGVQIGFTFNSDGTIDLLGSLGDGWDISGGGSGTVTAMWA